MPAKIRLSRHGKKAHAFYHIVVADSRAPRNGKFIEKIGTYNPNTNPATIDLNYDKALSWLQKGAEVTDTMRSILSYKGVLYKNHLAVGVKRGVLTQEQADAKYDAWIANKEGKIADKQKSVISKSQEAVKARLAAEAKVKEAKAIAIAAKAVPPAPEAPASVEAAPDAVAEQTPTAEAEAPAQESPAADQPETPSTEA